MGSKASGWDLNLAVFKDTEGVVAMVEALRRAGVRSVEFGYLEEDANDLWPDNPIHTFAHVEYHTKNAFGLHDSDRTIVKCERGTEFDRPDLALCEALAIHVRAQGGNVVIMVDGKNT
jgi:hypothetical protein